jgi:hypoxanthine phosphoribosyltransferase
MDDTIIKIHDKYFRKEISHEEIDLVIQSIANKMNSELKDKKPLFLAVLNGAFMFSAELFKKLDFPCEISFVKLASYEGTKTTETVRQLFGFDEDIEGRTVVIVEDIIDTGLTMEHILEQMRVKKAAEVRIATLLFKPDAFRGNYDIDYVGKEIPNDFIVGFGLDYNQNGRNYKDIYKVVQ